MSAHAMTEAHGKPLMRTFVRICNNGPRVKVRQDHLNALLVARLIYTVDNDKGKRFIHITPKGEELAGRLHEGRDF